MHRLIGKGTAKYGLPPGTLVHIGDRRMAEAKITVITYDEGQVREMVLVRRMKRVELGRLVLYQLRAFLLQCFLDTQYLLSGKRFWFFWLATHFS